MAIVRQLSRKQIRIPHLCLALVCLMVLLLTLMPIANNGGKFGQVGLTPLNHGSALVCVVTQCDKPPERVRSTLFDLFGNVGLFVPFGVIAGLTLEQKTRSQLERVGIVFVAGLLFSLSIEATQFWLPTRFTDIDDVIFNSSGALLGALLVAAFHIWYRQVRTNPAVVGLFPNKFTPAGALKERQVRRHAR